MDERHWVKRKSPLFSTIAIITVRHNTIGYKSHLEHHHRKHESILSAWRPSGLEFCLFFVFTSSARPNFQTSIALNAVYVS
jgi:hypothetical protein